MKKRILSLLVAVVCLAGVTDLQAAEKPSRMLFVTQSGGFHHGSVRRGQQTLSPAEVAIVQLGEESGLFTVDCTQDVEADFTKENLQNYDIVAFYTTGNLSKQNNHLPIAKEDLDYFLNEWAKEPGHGVLGFHSAMDTYHDYEPFWDMIGGTFIGHPWTWNTEVTIVNHEPDNPITEPFGEKLVYNEEIYMYRNWQPEKVRVLMSLDYSGSPVSNRVPTQHGYHVPVAWIKEYGDGRVYCNNMGHNESTWTRDDFQKSITQAIKWMRGEIEIDATPNPEVSAEQEEKARRDFEAGNFQAAR